MNYWLRKSLLFIFLLASVFSNAQADPLPDPKEIHWVDSVFKSLNDDQKIAQLMVIRAHSNLGPDHVARVANDIQQYDVGALCFFQGGPVRQANLTSQ